MYIHGSFRKLGVPYFVVRIIRIRLHKGISISEIPTSYSSPIKDAVYVMY